MKKLSIITVNLNNADGLERTIKSVVEQTYKDYQYIIIDGNSTDNSVEIIKQYDYHINYWVSEPNQGIYGNMNRGIKEVEGEYCLFLNSGDWFISPTILDEVFAQNPVAEIVAGDIDFYDHDIKAVRWHVPSPDQLTAKTLFMGTLPHQATFIKRYLFDKFGLYSRELKITSDWLFFVESLLVNNCTYQHYQGTVAYFGMDGISCDPRTDSLPRREQIAVLQERYPRFLPDFEHLDALEKQSLQWYNSHEYIVYRFLERIGVIRLGIFGYRAKRVLQRSFFRQVR